MLCSLLPSDAMRLFLILAVGAAATITRNLSTRRFNLNRSPGYSWRCVCSVSRTLTLVCFLLRPKMEEVTSRK